MSNVPDLDCRMAVYDILSDASDLRHRIFILSMDSLAVQIPRFGDMVAPSPWVGEQQDIFNHGTKLSQLSSGHDERFHHQCEAVETQGYAIQQLNRHKHTNNTSHIAF